MFEQWLKFWRQWMSFWLPGGDEPADTRPSRDTNQQTGTSSSDPESGDIDAATTWRPESPEKPAAGGRPDDLTAIKGIGPAIARQLDGFGVKTFADLAAADPEDLATKIGKRPVTSARVREWVAEAKKRTS